MVEVLCFQLDLEEEELGFGFWLGRRPRCKLSSVVMNPGSSSTSCSHCAAQVWPQWDQSSVPEECYRQGGCHVHPGSWDLTPELASKTGWWCIAKATGTRKGWELVKLTLRTDRPRFRLPPLSTLIIKALKEQRRDRNSKTSNTEEIPLLMRPPTLPNRCGTNV